MMRKKCRVAIDDQVFFASCGDVLLDAALINGIDIPHDCRSGHCGTCRVRVLMDRPLAGNAASRARCGHARAGSSHTCGLG